MTERHPMPVIRRAGTFREPSSLGRLHEAARNLEARVEVIETRTASQMRAMLRRFVAKGVNRIGIAGGDGMVSAAIQELARSRTALGIISFGTANNFASALRLPRDRGAALRVLLEDEHGATIVDARIRVAPTELPLPLGARR